MSYIKELEERREMLLRIKKLETFENFKNDLTESLDKNGFIAVSEVFNKIEQAEYLYSCSTLNNLKSSASQPLSQLMPDNFIVGLKVFISTLQCD